MIEKIGIVAQLKMKRVSASDIGTLAVQFIVKSCVILAL